MMKGTDGEKKRWKSEELEVHVDTQYNWSICRVEKSHNKITEGIVKSESICYRE